MGLFRKKPAGELVSVTVKVIGMLSDRYVSVMEEVEIADGGTVLDALRAMKDQGKIDKQVFGMIKDVKPPLQMLVNGTRVQDKKPAKVQLHKGDEVSILTATSGG